MEKSNSSSNTTRRVAETLNMSIYFQYFIQFLKSRLEYKLDFFAEIFANIVTSFSGLLFIFFLMDGEQINSLRDWSRDEVFFIYGYSLIPMALFGCVGINLYRFGDKYIIQGAFDRVLLRPLDSLAQVIFESFNLESVGSLIVGLTIFFYFGSNLKVELGVLDYLWLLLSAFSGAIILLSVFVFLSSLSFHFEDRLGIAAPVYNLSRFGRYPLPIFNKLIQFVLKWIVPFAFVAFYPATHFLDRKEYLTLCYASPLVSLASASIAYAMWRFGVSRYASTGN